MSDITDIERDMGDGDNTKECRYCRNGRISVDGGSLIYRCPDCEGKGYINLPKLEDDDPE